MFSKVTHTKYTQYERWNQGLFLESDKLDLIPQIKNKFYNCRTLCVFFMKTWRLPFLLQGGSWTTSDQHLLEDSPGKNKIHGSCSPLLPDWLYRKSYSTYMISLYLQDQKRDPCKNKQSNKQETKKKRRKKKRTW